MIYTILILLTLCLLTYLFFFIIKNKSIPESFSKTSYLLQEWGYSYKIFMYFCIFYGIVLLPIWLHISPEPWQFLAFLSCGGLIFVGTTPLYRESYQHNIHWGAGITCVTSAALWVVLNSTWEVVITSSILCLIAFSLNKFKNFVFWIEITTMLTSLLVLIQKYFEL